MRRCLKTLLKSKNLFYRHTNYLIIQSILIKFFSIAQLYYWKYLRKTDKVPGCIGVTPSSLDFCFPKNKSNILFLIVESNFNLKLYLHWWHKQIGLYTPCLRLFVQAFNSNVSFKYPWFLHYLRKQFHISQNSYC